MSTVSRPALLVVVAVLAVGAAGCGSSSNNSSSSGTTASSTSTTTGAPTSAVATGASDNITIQNFKFNPDPLPVKQGAKVTIAILDDGVPHSVTADDNSFDTGIFMKSNGPKTITVSKSGTVKYHCEVHSFMKGTIDAT